MVLSCAVLPTLLAAAPPLTRHPPLQEIHDHKFNEQKSKGIPAVAKVAISLQASIAAIDDMLPYYLEVSEKLARFDELDEFGPATRLRTDIMAKCQELARFGKQLKAVNDQMAKKPGFDPKGDAQRLRMGMLKRISEYVQENMIGLPKLPTKEKIGEALKRQEAQRSNPDAAVVPGDSAGSQPPRSAGGVTAGDPTPSNSRGGIKLRIAYEPDCLVV